MKSNILKLIRILLAIVIFLPIVFFLCDFADIVPNSFANLLKIQLVPAVLSGSIVILIVLAALTILFGRIYCSIICPLGILQDIIAWFTKRGKKKNKKKRWYHYAKPQHILRYALLAICIAFLIFGITTPLTYLDPYSNFGRIAVNIFRPITIEGNNLLNLVALKFNNFSFYHVTIHTVTMLSLTIAFIAFLVVGLMSLLRGRLFCNTICPVGSFLGLIAKYALFRIIVDESRCNKCGSCEKSCKSECINSKEGLIDHSRCVTCFNCIETCNKKKALNYRFAYKPSTTSLEEKFETKREITSLQEPLWVDSGRTNKGMNRRSFMLTSAAIAVSVPFVPAWAQKQEIDVTKLTPVTPPGSRGLKHFKAHCTACHLCVTHCPQQILKPAGFKYGIDYAFKPHMVFFESAYCNYECTVCSEVCPNGAIERLTKEEKIVTQVGIAQFAKERCVVYTEHTSCGACSEHCPVKAVRMEPYIGGLTLPRMYPELCIGCGGCESICPVRPVKAINVMANEFHHTAEKPVEEEMKEINSEDLEFGF
ncbi:MAG: 4Fe-4S binding protein [Candidatus Symbiothrix sp.]|nr:4Fe-4S binding protein [Candidatus Symbiothrix sp.]